jgi:Mg2+ and Co2+ transporter CorA
LPRRFQRRAQSPRFLVFELWEHQVEGYLAVQELLEERVEKLPDALRGERVDDVVSGAISELGADLLHFRPILLPARAALTGRARRKSIFIGEATRGVPRQHGGHRGAPAPRRARRSRHPERVVAPSRVAGRRRTNLVMDRFTVVSAVFPPGTCLVGV